MGKPITDAEFMARFCPVHGVQWAKAKWGAYYCPTKARGPWEKQNDRGWCDERPKA